MNNKEIGLYIHIPFCKSKCFYCDFNSFAGKEELITPYFCAVKRELEYYKQSTTDCTIKTIFIGGGTPSLIETSYLAEVLKLCNRDFNIENTAEITIETNPGTLTYEKLTGFKAMGINRLSIGLQAWQNGILSGIGRIHTIEDFLENFNQARRVGFENINIDLIFGLPGQTLKDWEETLDNVIMLNPEHVSCYSLKIEEETEFGKMQSEGKITAIDDELDREMYHMAKEVLKVAKLNQYEISNFSKPGYECIHNLNYWGPGEYLGIGAGAHSFFEGKRYNNICSVENYISSDFKLGLPVENIDIIEEKEAMTEYLILRLRLMEGVKLSDFKKRFDEDLIELFENRIDKLLNRGLLKRCDDTIKLTDKGMDLANEVLIEFI